MRFERCTVISLITLSFAVAGTFSAKADDHGCQVLLCLSNPGGATQYAACVPPITKLYEDLAKGKPFPICTGGGGVETSAPVYDPYSCSAGFVLDTYNNKAYCRSPSRTRSVDCPESGEDTSSLPFGGPKDVTDSDTPVGRRICRDFEYSTVQRNEKPNYMDVKISATGNTVRIRY